MVVWLIGLSGSGKTTLADKIVSDLRLADETIVSLDGDILRELWEMI